jgi:nitrate/nitrite transporter NarK
MIDMSVSNSVLGLVVGLVLGVTGAFGGFGAFLIVLVLGAVGLLVGRLLDGELDLERLTGRGRSTSTRL